MLSVIFLVITRQTLADDKYLIFSPQQQPATLSAHPIQHQL
jgi:hypothetical protein